MSDKRSVTILFHSWQDGNVQQYRVQGELHRLITGWALTYREPADEGDRETESAAETQVTLIAHERELRLRRRGAVSLEQTFQTGFALPGKLQTAYGSFNVEALTSQLDMNFSELGGVIEWKYDLMMQDQAGGSFQIRLDIREEQAE